jgi:drug/metabolite transporter (DMT)-like permease
MNRLAANGPRVGRVALQVPAVTAAYTAAALVAFAGNSVLCRLALGRQSIDPASFSTVRLIAGAAVLLLISGSTRSRTRHVEPSWTSAAILFVYAVPFSLAYVSLTVGTGALILFGAVQLTMMAAALRLGERPRPAQWLGLTLALAGLVYLVLPGLAAPPLSGAALMAVAGIAWGVYSARGRAATDPLAQTTSNFVRAVPFAAAFSLATLSRANLHTSGILLAVASGALTSGIGYVLWYAALRGLTGARAAVVQLLVPTLAGAGGVVFIGESVSVRLIVSAVTVLGGIALAIFGAARPPQIRAGR